jgi:hypothetical protein
MHRQLRHCGKKFPVQTVYSIRNYEQFSQLFLFVGGPCPHCQKTLIAHAGYDIWGHPVLFRAEGSPVFPADSSASPPGETGSRFEMAGKKTMQKYWKLIENGHAQKVEKLPKHYRHQKGGPAGVSQYSLYAARQQSQSYVLRLIKLVCRNMNAHSQVILRKNRSANCRYSDVGKAAP